MRMRMLPPMGHSTRAAGSFFCGVRQADEMEEAKVGVTEIDFARGHREFGRILNVMVIVVQRFAAGEDRPDAVGKVARLVGCFEIAVSPPVTETVDDDGGKKRNPRHLYEPHPQTGRSED